VCRRDVSGLVEIGRSDSYLIASTYQRRDGAGSDGWKGGIYAERQCDESRQCRFKRAAIHAAEI